MKRSKQFKVSLLALTIAIGGLALGERYSVPGVTGFVGKVSAEVGRPLTPVSVAGVARRTGRRCASGVYNC